MHELLVDSLEAGATVVTVNHRLARGLRFRFNARQIDRGRAAWRTPSIVSFDAWCDALWSACVDSGAHGGAHVPSGAQEEALWERIVAESPEGNGLIQTERTARQALEAWGLAAAWRIAIPDEGDPDLNDDCRVFSRWASRYDRELADRHWIDRARLPDLLAEALAAGVIEPPGTIWLAGFDELKPQQSDLIEAMRAHGATIDELEPQPHEPSVLALALEDSDEELRSAARWARSLLDGGASGPIGIVVPELQSMRARVDAFFADYLLPSAVLPGGGEVVLPYNISSGRPLSEYPVVASALIALEACTGEVAIERIGGLLRSPFIGGAESELSQRALLDARMRRNGRTATTAAELYVVASGGGASTAGRQSRAGRTASARVSNAAAMEAANGAATEAANGTGATYAATRLGAARTVDASARPYHAPDLARRIDEFQRVCRAHRVSERKAPSKWAQAFAEMLKALGWPGDRVVTSAEQQAIARWWELLATYATLDGVIPGEDAIRAVRRLARMAGGATFQPSNDDTPVQILGTLEAAGMSFEHLWITGMHDEEMPATPKPNPFLPLRLQRTHRVARASAERELVFARTVVNGLLAAAPDVVVSYPQSDGERPLEPSPLIAHLDPKPVENLPWALAQHFATIIHESREHEMLVDEMGPPIEASGAIRGGTSILKDQAACPFRAFAHHRLGARPLGTPAPGLDAMERGRLMHTVLELIWHDLKTHEALVALDDESLGDTIARHVATAVEGAAGEHPETFSERFATIERQRLERIMRAWLELERQRMPFTMLAIEEERDVTVGGITMTVRIDRIDELRDGRKIFIDYKTSRNPSKSKWFGDRPDEPQLPIYCHECDEVAAVLFVQLKPDKVRFDGIAAETGIVPGIKEFKGIEADGIFSWQDINPRWKSVLESISRSFLRGEASVSPKDPRQTCAYCDVGPLCRVREMGLEEEDL